jgi:predicted AAA+ superfamily ATPase
VANHLSRKEAIAPKTKDFGDAFEHFIVLEIRAAISYFRKNGSMTYWRTHAGHEVDILIDNNIAIECKSTSLVQDRDLKGLRALRAENIFKEFYIISLDSKRRKTEDGIHILPCEDFLNLLWSGELLGEIS